MLAKVNSSALLSIDGYPVSVETDVSGGLPNIFMVGLPEAEVKESKERVISAIKNSGFDFPLKRITVNLSPARTKKSGTHFDLPIALGIIAASGQLSPAAVEKADDFVFLGELSLDGKTHFVKGVLPMLVGSAKENYRNFIVPKQNMREAAVCSVGAFYASSLAEVVDFLEGKTELAPCLADIGAKKPPIFSPGDFSEVKSQQLAKRALEIAAAGGHNVLMMGPPGSGKSMLAKRFAGILPPMTEEESLEVSKIYSSCGKYSGELIENRPFRDPHHTVSAVALAGGGSTPKPGEVSLAHNGVLFLDEVAEFSRSALEILREPLESFKITVSRAKDTVSFPAKFTLISAMNPCPCGYYGHREKHCKCSPSQISKYRAKMSGPLLDRIDMTVNLSPVQYGEWRNPAPDGETSAKIRNRVICARAIQRQRFKECKTVSNAFMSVKDIKKYCKLPDEAHTILEFTAKKLALSARSLDKMLKTARTIADLDNSADIKKEHLMEVIQYRAIDREV